MESLIPYLDEYHAFKSRLFELYQARGAHLVRKESARGGGTTWGYQLAAWGSLAGAGKLTGSSIGDDEIHFFFDLCQLIRPHLAYVVGNGFGLSTFCLALALPACEVVAIDNWSEGAAGVVARDLSLDIGASLPSHNAHIVTGTSPEDTDKALRVALGRLPDVIDLAFIDGLHNDRAARADFEGMRAYLTHTSIVLWHNVHATAGTFLQVASETAAPWDQHWVLRTYGPLGIFLSSRDHPRLQDYLRDTNLIWNGWDRFLPALMAAGAANPARRNSAAPWWTRPRAWARRVLRAVGFRRTPRRGRQ